MRFQALKNFQAKNGNSAIEIKAGQMITLPDDKAVALSAKGLVTPELNEKPGGQGQTTEVTSQETEATPKPSELDTVTLSQMPLKDFEKAGLCLKIDSQVLGEEIYFVSDEKAIPGYLPKNAFYYTGKELQALINQNIQPGSLRLIHEVKKLFDNATITRGEKKR